MSVELEVYDTSHPKLGVVLIFNHLKYQDEKIPQRHGSLKDTEDLQNVLKKIGFEVRTFADETLENIKKILHNVAREDHSNSDCVVVIVMTHGGAGKLEAYDTEYNEEILWESFMGSNSPTLVGKPKLFFVQACRGGKEDHGFLRTTELNKTNACSSTAVDAKPFIAGNYEKRIVRVPSHLDLLVMHSTQMGYISFRDLNEGSCFIQELCAAFEDLASSSNQQDIVHVLTKVIGRVGIRSSAEGQKQTPIIQSSLSKQFNLKRKQNMPPISEPLPMETPCRGGKA